MHYSLTNLKLIILFTLLCPCLLANGQERGFVLKSTLDSSIVVIETEGGWQVYSVYLNAETEQIKEDDTPVLLFGNENLKTKEELGSFIGQADTKKILVDPIIDRLSAKEIDDLERGVLYYGWIDTTTVWLRSESMDPKSAVLHLSSNIRDFKAWKSSSEKWQKKPGLGIGTIEEHQREFRGRHKQAVADSINEINTNWNTLLDWMATIEGISYPTDIESTNSMSALTFAEEIKPTKAVVIIGLGENMRLVLVVEESGLKPVLFRLGADGESWDPSYLDGQSLSEDEWHGLAFNPDAASFVSSVAMEVGTAIDAALEESIERVIVKHMTLVDEGVVALFQMPFEEVAIQMTGLLKPRSAPIVFGYQEEVEWNILGLIISAFLFVISVMIGRRVHRNRQLATHKENDEGSENGVDQQVEDDPGANGKGDDKQVEQEETKSPEANKLKFDQAISTIEGGSNHEFDSAIIRVFSAELLEKKSDVAASLSKVSASILGLLESMRGELETKKNDLKGANAQIVRINKEKGKVEEELSIRNGEIANLKSDFDKLNEMLKGEQKKLLDYEKDQDTIWAEEKKRGDQLAEEANELKAKVTKLKGDLEIVNHELDRKRIDLEEKNKKYKLSQQIYELEKLVNEAWRIYKERGRGNDFKIAGPLTVLSGFLFQQLYENALHRNSENRQRILMASLHNLLNHVAGIPNGDDISSLKKSVKLIEDHFAVNEKTIKEIVLSDVRKDQHNYLNLAIDSIRSQEDGFDIVQFYYDVDQNGNGIGYGGS